MIIDQYASRKLLLIDNDPTYGYFMQVVANSRGVHLRYFQHLVDATLGGCRVQDFDAVILDFDLGDLNGIEVAEYIQYFMGNIPVLIIGNTQCSHQVLELGPHSIVGFKHKSEGYEGILDAVLHSAPLHGQWLHYFRDKEAEGHEL